MRKHNARLFFLFSLVVFILGAIIYWFSDVQSTLKSAEAEFALSRDAEVSRIEFREPQNDQVVVLEKDNNERWRLNEILYANDLAVDELIGVLNRLRVRQPVSIAHRERVDSLLEEKGILVRVYVSAHRLKIGNLRLFPYQKRSLTFISGPDTPDGRSTYMRKTGSENAFKVHVPAYSSGISSVFLPNEKVWRDPLVFDLKPEEIAWIEVLDLYQPEGSFLLKVKEYPDFTFYNPEDKTEKLEFQIDSSRVKRFVSSFEDIYYENLLDSEGEQLRNKLMFEQPFKKITVTSKDGNTITISAFEREKADTHEKWIASTERDPNRFYVEINNNEFALAQFYVFSRILRPLSFFENKANSLSSDQIKELSLQTYNKTGKK